ncbi:MAG: hypothetical protein LUG96_12760, partial [Tannerellaceae bacterium]|nr:hypothetical protein [Tannerellaceae bacterium]
TPTSNPEFIIGHYADNHYNLFCILLQKRMKKLFFAGKIKDEHLVSPFIFIFIQLLRLTI